MIKKQPRFVGVFRLPSSKRRLPRKPSRKPSSATSTPCPSWGQFYPEFVDAVRHAGIEIAFIHVDLPLNRIGPVVGYDDLRNLQQLISDELKIEYGVICTDNRGGMESDAYCESLQRLEAIFPREADPDAFIVMSWYHYPRYAVRIVEHSIPMAQATLELFRLWNNQMKKVNVDLFNCLGWYRSQVGDHRF
jgi:hypothetical protein